MSQIKYNCCRVEQIKIENCKPDALKKKHCKKDTVKSSSQKCINKQPNASKIFTIYEKRKMIEPLRHELLTRGWTEKIIEDSSSLPKFVWLARSNDVVIEGSPIVNRLKMEPLKNFCYKDVLIDYGRAAKSNEKIALNMPRTFKLFSNERKDFIENYRLTAYSSFIRYLYATGSKTFSKIGRINSDWISFAIEKLEEAIDAEVNKKCVAADNNTKSSGAVNKKQSVAEGNGKTESKENSLTEKAAAQKKEDCEFERFKKIYQSVVKFRSKIRATGEDVTMLLHKCNGIYKQCKTVWKDFEKDGFYNLWLLKPARRSLGFGIKLFDEDFDILSYAKDNDNMKYLVQKYVERPLLIYNTKFDLRQYFLIVHHKKSVCLWMYKMCYLKFSTKLYDPLNYKVSVHITNTAIQSKYAIDKNRSRNIPKCNEWSSDRFLAYLKKENRLSLWDQKIYPAMKRNIIATVSAAYNSTTIQPDRFQLYGCDFVIDENYDPILLEINGLPILTSVICPMCLQDLVKVIVDKRENPKADTGHFEKIWEKRF